MARTFGITVFCAHSGPNFSTNFFKFNVAASRIAYTENADNSDNYTYQLKHYYKWTRLQGNVNNFFLNIPLHSSFFFFLQVNWDEHKPANLKDTEHSLGKIWVFQFIRYTLILPVLKTHKLELQQQPRLKFLVVNVSTFHFEN